MPKATHKIKAAVMSDESEGDFSLVPDVSFSTYGEFKAWVKAEKSLGVTFLPLRQTGAPLTWKSVEVGKLE